MKKTLNIHKYKGFTLIEVLIALLILGISLSAMIKTVDDDSRNVAKLKDFTIAHWIGDDTIRVFDRNAGFGSDIFNALGRILRA